MVIILLAGFKAKELRLLVHSSARCCGTWVATEQNQPRPASSHSTRRKSDLYARTYQLGVEWSQVYTFLSPDPLLIGASLLRRKAPEEWQAKRLPCGARGALA